MNSNIVVLLDSNDAENTYNNGKYTVFENLPCPKVFDVNGHVAMRVGDAIAHHLALRRGL